LKNSISEEIHKRLEELNISQHGIFTREFSRLYIGNEFCQNLLPEAGQLVEFIQKAGNEGFNITICYPYLKESYIDSCTDMLDKINIYCRESNIKLEITINDWGLLQLVSNKFPYLSPVLGRLLNKRKKDPRDEWKWKVEAYEDSMEENHLNEEKVNAFYKKYGISRYEYEVHNYYNKIAEGNHSLHFPFYQMVTSMYCHLFNSCTNLKGSGTKSIKQCQRYCSEMVYLYPSHLSTIGKGNSIFGFSDVLFKQPDILEKYIKSGIDRLIFTA